MVRTDTVEMQSYLHKKNGINKIKTYRYRYVTNTELKPPQKNCITNLETAMPLAVVYAPNVSNTSKQPTQHIKSNIKITCHSKDQSLQKTQTTYF